MFCTADPVFKQSCSYRIYRITGQILCDKSKTFKVLREGSKKNTKVWSLTIRGGVIQKPHPYCKICFLNIGYVLSKEYVQKNYVKKIYNKETTLKLRGGGQRVWSKTTLLHFFFTLP